MGTALQRAKDVLLYLIAAIGPATGRHHIRPGTRLRLVLHPGPAMPRPTTGWTP